MASLFFFLILPAILPYGDVTILIELCLRRQHCREFFHSTCDGKKPVEKNKAYGKARYFNRETVTMISNAMGHLAKISFWLRI